MFKDEFVVTVKGGRGGKGCISFRREKFVPKGGPDGGCGGKGGNVILMADENLNTLYHLSHISKWFAQDGRAGGPNNRTGKNGQDLLIRLPVGTLVYDLQKGLLLKDLKAHGESIVIAKGGRGGRGNRSFATPTRRAPRIAEEGQPGEQRRIRFELKLIANAGIIGLPNSGKSTLLSKISAARPKIADFPFTTLYPCLGIVRGGDYRTCVVADLPGLIEGASCNIGLGHKFLKHIERTSILIHIVDVSQSAVSPPQDAYLTVRQELSNYSQQLAQKDEIIVANKMDLPGARRGLRMLAKVVPCPPIAVSALKAEGLDTLICTLFDRLP